MRDIEQEIPTKINFLHKSLRGIKSFLYKRRQKLPNKSSLVRPFACGSNRQDLLLHHKYYSWDEDDANNMTDKTNQYRDVKKQDPGGASSDASSSSSCNGSFMKFANMPRLDIKKLDEQETKARVDKMGKREDLQGDHLHRVDVKMEELSEMENMLDMEEAIHYYSRLRSPVYLGIVDKFLMDIYSDFTVDDHESSASIINSSRRKFSSTRL